LLSQLKDRTVTRETATVDARSQRVSRITISIWRIAASARPNAAAIERHLRRLYDAAKDADPGALVTDVNYLTTEYLELPFLDLVCFNVYPGDPVRERRPWDQLT